MMQTQPTYCCLIIMGVSGTGKSSLGLRLAQTLGVPFLDGDDLHPENNLQKMAAGIPLNDEDRAPWLQRISERIDTWEQEQKRGIMVCSALKRNYRDRIRGGKQNRLFLFLDGSYELIFQRLQSRQGHFMGPQMLQSQFSTLEVPDQEPDVIRLSIEGTLEEVANRALEMLTAANFMKREIV